MHEGEPLKSYIADLGFGCFVMNEFITSFNELFYHNNPLEFRKNSAMFIGFLNECKKENSFMNRVINEVCGDKENCPDFEEILSNIDSIISFIKNAENIDLENSDSATYIYKTAKEIIEYGKKEINEYFRTL